MNNKLAPQIIEHVSKIFKALSEPIRIRILQELAEEKSVSELCADINTSQPNLSKHLKILFELKLLSRRQEGNMVYYSITDPMVDKLCDLVCRGIQQKIDSEIRNLTSTRAALQNNKRAFRRVS